MSGLMMEGINRAKDEWEVKGRVESKHTRICHVLKSDI